jgi:hypothetical protein
LTVNIESLVATCGLLIFEEILRDQADIEFEDGLVILKIIEVLVVTIGYVTY